jgi:DNA-binding transcriptional LysR family regulator
VIIEIRRAAMRLQEKVQQLDSGLETTLVIAKDTIIPDGPLFEIVSEFCQLDKLVEISMIEEALGGGRDALYSRRADIAIGVGSKLPKGQFTALPIDNIEFVFVVAARHSLADYEGIIESDLIRQYPSIIVSNSSRALPSRSSELFESKQ